MDINENFSEMSTEEQADAIAKQFFQEEDPVQEPEENQDQPEQETAAQEETAPKEDEPKPADNFYTMEEFVTESPLNVDAERLPEGARLVHNRYMEFYEREVAPMLRELEALKESQRGQQEPVRDTIVEDVQREAMRRLGVSELDTYDAKHITMLNLVSREMADQRAEQKSERQRLSHVAAEIQNSPGFAAVDRWAQEQIQRMPKVNADTILKEIYSGDPAKIKAVYDAFQKKYTEIKQKPAAKKETPVVPPAVIPGSNSSEKDTPKFGYDDFARASSKDQANMLIGMGLIDDIEE